MKYNYLHTPNLIIPVATLVLLLWPLTATCSDKTQSKADQNLHDDFLKYKHSHNILPFEEILALVRPYIDGEIIETEIEIEDDILSYEFKYIDGSGRVIELYVDAQTGKIHKKEEDGHKHRPQKKEKKDKAHKK
ncbi:MAG: PepSY domain-containing protein [Hyphomicrobiaceae bacterium]|nr:PepSY domain-containing protein [Hyphomicrobiaceae bacterium]